jgi:hypothetical protein
MNSPKPTTANRGINVHSSTHASGRVRCRVLNADGSLAKDYGWQKNLILDSGLDYFVYSSAPLTDRLVSCNAGTGTTPNKRAEDGTYSQSGTTVTRDTGTGTFVVGDVGKRIRFSTGEQAKITAFGSSTSVTVDKTQTVAATTLEIFNTDAQYLATYVKGTSTLSAEAGANTYTRDSGTGDMMLQKTWNFTAESGSVNYTELGIASNVGATPHFSRILLDSAVSLTTGQQLVVTYQLTLTEEGPIVADNRDITISGWPYEYTIESITSTGSNFTVTLNKAHHFPVAGEVTIAGALPVKATITGITSTVSDFTVTTGTAHGLSPADSIEIEDCSVGAYNGTWTVASVGSTTEYTVTSGADPGVASDGTSRLSTPGTWYNGTWTIASVSGADLTITSAINPIDAGASGTAKNNLTVDVLNPYYGYKGVGETVPGGAPYSRSFIYEGTTATAYLIQNSNKLTPSSFPWTYASTPTGAANTSAVSASVSYTAGSGLRTNSVTWDLDTGNYSDIKQIAVFFHSQTKYYLGMLITFEQLQRKDSGYSLSLTFTRQFEQLLA